MDNEKKIKVLARKISFLMPHQEVLPDLKEIIEQLKPSEEGVDKNSEEYILGAYDALKALIDNLIEKGVYTSSE